MNLGFFDSQLLGIGSLSIVLKANKQQQEKHKQTKKLHTQTTLKQKANQKPECFCLFFFKPATLKDSFICLFYYFSSAYAQGILNHCVCSYSISQFSGIHYWQNVSIFFKQLYFDSVLDFHQICLCAFLFSL